MTSVNIRTAVLLTTCLTAVGIVAAPSQVLAACVIGGSPNAVNCNADTGTTDTTNANAAATSSSDRHQTFSTGGDVTATIQSGVAVTGAGLAVSSTEVGAGVNFSNLGSIALSATPSAGGAAVLNLNAAGGNIVYSGAGTIDGSVAGSAGLFASTSGAGTVNITADGAVTLADSVGSAIRTVTATGSATVTANATVSSGGHGIDASTSGGSISIQGMGNVFGDTNVGGVGVGVLAVISGGSGSIDVNLLGTVASALDDGIVAIVNSGGTGGATVTVNNDVTSGGGNGVRVETSAANLVSIVAGATVTGTTGLATGGTGATTIVNSGGLTGTGGTAVALASSGIDTFVMNGPSATLTGSATGDGNDIFRFDGTGANTFDAGQIGGGFSDVQKQGAGTWTLTGTGTYSSSTSLNAGTLILDGTLAGSTLTVGSAGTLSGTGAALGVVVNGTIAPGPVGGIGTLQSLGATFNAGSTYQVDVAGATNDRVEALGVTINGGTVNLASASGVVGPAQYTIVTSAGRTGTFAGSTSSLAFYSTNLIYNATDVILAIAPDYTASGLTPNQTATGQGLNSVNGGPFAAELLALLTPQGPGALDQLSGDAHASFKGIFIESSDLIRNLVYDRVAQAKAAPPATEPSAYTSNLATLSDAQFAVAQVAAPQAPSDKGYWGSVYGDRTLIAGDGNAAGTASLSGGLAVGADAGFGDWKVGVLGALGGTALNGRSTEGRSIDLSAGLYGAGAAGPVDLTFGAAYTRHMIQTSRTINFPGVASSVSASYQASTAQAFIQAGHTFDLNGVGLTPFANLAAVAEHTDAFSESGLGGLSSEASDSYALFTTIGLGGSKAFTAGTTAGEVSASVGWRHAIASTPSAVNSFAGGTPFTVLSAPLAGDVITLAAGLNLDISPEASIRIDYDGEIGTGIQSHAGRVTFGGKL